MIMKVIYDKQSGTLLDAVHVLIGDIDLMEQVTEEAMIKEVVSQNRPLYEFENEKAAETAKDCLEPVDRQEQFVVWICYITDNYGNPLVVKVVPTETQAQMWVDAEPLSLGTKDDEMRGSRFAEKYIVER